MTQLADSPFGATDVSQIVKFSPDSSRFVIVTKKGNIHTNTNDYSLLQFDTAKALGSSSPEVLASLSSTSSRPAIEEVKWLDDETLSFLGEHASERQQVYKLSCKTRDLTKLTDYPGALLNYSLSSDGKTIVFLAEPQAETILTDEARRNGILVSEQDLLDLYALINHPNAQLFVQQSGLRSSTRVDVSNVIPPQAGLPFAVSPDGRYLVLEAYVRTVPEIWDEYTDSQLQGLLQRGAKGGTDYYDVGILLLVNLTTGQSEPLINAPVPAGWADIAWSPDGTSVAVAGTYLPLNISDTEERHLRKSATFVAEVKIPSGQIVPITSRPLKLLRWDSGTNHLVLQETERATAVDIRGKTVEYERVGGSWRQSITEARGFSGNGQFTVEIRQNPNTPSRLFAHDTKSGREFVLFDPNPQFQNLEFGRVEDIAFKALDGHEVKGGLYYPSRYQRGIKYPLVIQTHGWNPQLFSIDGPYPTAFIAQPLAGKQIFVLQLEEELPHMSSDDEGELEMSGYEGAVDYLDQRGMIDRNRVGLIGFSRTDYHVKYALTHSTFHFAAASTTEGFDAGYFQYIALATHNPSYAWSFETANGGLPFGDGLSAWSKQSPGFNLDRVHTPVRLLVNERDELFTEWEWFSGLSRLHKPVEMIYLPEGDHILIRPWERMVSQGGNLDWFCFWLKNEEDPDPAKADQYARWRELRKLQEQNHSNAPTK